MRPGSESFSGSRRRRPLLRRLCDAELAPRCRSNALALAFAGLLVIAGSAPATAQPGSEELPSRWAGRPLTEALAELRARGLRLVYTSSTVTEEMRVLAEPTAGEPRAILEELLAPHGLTGRDGPNETVVIVALGGPVTPRAASLRGAVRSRRSGAPVEGAEVRLPALGLSQSTAADGSYDLEVAAGGEFEVEVRRRGFAVEHVDVVALVPGQPTRLDILLDPVPVTEEELIVTPSRVSLLREEPVAPLALSRDDILALPHLGDDFFRALSLLPGISANDVSAEFHVRGGRTDETQILLDGQELYDSYHLKDYDNALSVVAPATLESVDLSTGGFSVEHGDRMSGVLDMTTVTPSGPRRTLVGLSALNVHLGSAGTFAASRGSWIAQVRRGSIDLASRLLGRENPRFWDGFGKLDYQLRPRSSLRLNLLHSSDELELVDIGVDGEKRYSTGYQSSYLWVTLQTLFGPSLFVDSAVSRSNVDRDRNGLEIEDDAAFDIRDVRDLRVLAVRQDWSLQLGDEHLLRWGAGLRQFDTAYDYASSFAFANPLAVIRENAEEGSIRFNDRFEDHHGSAYVSDRFRLAGPATLELGVRLDRHTQTDEDLLSPRANLAVALGERSIVRAAWGRFGQSQRPYELQVQDGDTRFHPVERSENRLVGFEHHFARSSGSGPVLRVELYQRRIRNPLPRFENLYEPINTFPEVEPDRVRIEPERSLAEGIEVFLRGSARGRIGWWANYAWARTEDRVAGRWARRRFDQPHTLNLDLDCRIGEHWTLNLAFRYHTGWPTTALTLEPVEGDEGELEFVPTLGPRFAERLPDYHRLDLRASRRWRAGPAEVVFFVDVQNLYDRANVAGFDFDIDEETGVVIPNAEEWAPILPSAGIRFEF